MIAIVIIGYILLISVILFVLMGIDKYKAKHQLWRIPEKTLLILGIIGGGIGGFIGGRIFHHKTRKWYFQVAWIIGSLVAIVMIVMSLK